MRPKEGTTLILMLPSGPKEFWKDIDIEWFKQILYCNKIYFGHLISFKWVLSLNNQKTIFSYFLMNPLPCFLILRYYK